MTSPRIRFTQHALLKFQVLKDHGLDLDSKKVEETVQRPLRVIVGYRGRRIAQSELDADRVLRVVYEESGSELIIITFYPGKKARYA